MVSVCMLWYCIRVYVHVACVALRTSCPHLSQVTQGRCGGHRVWVCQSPPGGVIPPNSLFSLCLPQSLAVTFPPPADRTCLFLVVVVWKLWQHACQRQRSSYLRCPSAECPNVLIDIRLLEKLGLILMSSLNGWLETYRSGAAIGWPPRGFSGPDEA